MLGGGAGMTVLQSCTNSKVTGTRVMSTCVDYCLLLVFLTHLSILPYKTAEGLTDYSQVSSLLPATFPTGGSYTVRYLAEDGTDNTTCLESQPFPDPDNSDIIIYCRTLRYALFGNHGYENNQSVSNLIVLVRPGQYPYGTESIALKDFTNLVISKVPNSVGEVVFYCQKNLELRYNNLYIRYSSYVAVNDVVFERCGPLSPGMGTRSVEWLTVSNCIARDNYHTGIINFQSVNITFSNCTFENNNSTAPYNVSVHLNPGEIRFAGALSISWQNLTNSVGFAEITNCRFVNNTVWISHLNINDTRPNLYIPQGHGGAISTHFYNTANHILRIDNTTVRDNTAKFNGGGAFFSFYQNANNNKITITNSNFEENKSVLGTGGGVSMSTFYKSNNNHLYVANTDFLNNTASLGGGGCSINIQDQLIERTELSISNVATFEGCKFESNLSPEGGSAVSLVSNARVDQALNTTNFINCSFLSNVAHEEGAVLSLRFPIKFDGRTVFKNNIGGGVAILQSRMDVGGWVWFEGNTAEQGGALVLRDQSVMQVLRDTNMTFIRNSASQGGAISVISPSVGLDTDIIRLFNTRCFIQYDVVNTPDSTQPSYWNATFSFIDNTAELNGAAIHATDIKRCTYTPSLNTVDTNTVTERSIFSLNGLFYFSGNVVVDNTTVKANMSVASAPSNLLLSPQEVTGAPGEVIEFKIRAVDQSNNWRRAVWSLHDKGVTTDPTDGQDFFVLTPAGSTHRYTVRSMNGFSYENCSDSETLHQNNIDFSLVQIIAGDIASTTTSTVGVTCCRPGYVFNNNRSKCEYNRKNRVILRGDVNHRYLYIEPEHYATVRNGKLVSAVIPPTFQNCSTQGTLRGCLHKFDNEDDQCANNRSGFLCGNCPEGQGLDLTLRSCKECTVGDTVWVTVIVVFFTIGAVLVIAFNIGVPNDLKGCFFFVQVVGFVYQGGTDWDFHLSRLLASFYLPLCPLPSYSAYITASYGFVLSVVSVLIIVVYVICARFIRRLGHHSALEGIWLLCIITIKYAADTAYLQLRCQKVTGEDVYGEFVYFYDGTKACFTYDDHSSHLALAVIAIALLLAVIAAIIAILVISYRRFKHTQAFTDILTKGVKVSCRWWSAFDLLRRLLIVLVALGLNYIQPDFNQLAQFAVCLVIFFTFAIFQPYKERRSNIIEALILLDLLLLTSLFLNTADQSQDTVNGLAALLLVLPFIYGFLYIVINIVSVAWNKCSPTSFMKFCQQVSHLLMRGKWKGKVEGGISHDLDRFISVSKTNDGSIVETELHDSAEFSSEYSELREELLDLSPS